MKKRNVFKRSNKLGNTGRRRALLKRVHQKVNLRRQQFQNIELYNDVNDQAEQTPVLC